MDEKKIIREEIISDLEITKDGEALDILRDLITRIEQYKDQYLSIYFAFGYYVDDAVVVGERFETDEEFNLRLAQEHGAVLKEKEDLVKRISVAETKLNNAVTDRDKVKWQIRLEGLRKKYYDVG